MRTEEAASRPEPVADRAIVSLAWCAAALSGVFTGLHLALWTLAAPIPGAIDSRGEVGLGVPFAVVGALIVSRRPRNRIGWLFCAIGFLSSLRAALDAYALYALASRPDAELPGAVAAAWATLWIHSIPIALLVLFVPLLYPTGRLASPRWRPVAWLGGMMLLATSISFAFGPGPITASEVPVAPNPMGIAAAADVLETLSVAAFFLFLPLAIAGQISLVLRFRRARGVERQQLKWLAYAVGSVAAYLLLLPLSFLVVRYFPGELVVDLLGNVPIIAVPVALGIAVLRYRLYDIDQLISRTLVYGLLTVALGFTYAGAVFVLGNLLNPTGGQSELAVAASTLLVAALFRPVRRRVQGMVDRRFNRRRYDAATTIEAFSARLRDQIDLDTLTAELLTVTNQTMQPTHVSLWLRPMAAGGTGRS